MIEALKCTQCSANIDMSKHINGVVSCEYCGTYHFISDDWYKRFQKLPERTKDNSFRWSSGSMWVSSSRVRLG